MPRKKKIEPVVNHPPCAIPGCGAPGEFKAPRSRQSLNEFQQLCLEHIRQFNQSWDYFRDMSQTEIEHFQKDAVTGHRPTWGINDHTHMNAEALHVALSRFMGDGVVKPYRPPAPPIPPKVKQALALLDVEHPTTKKVIKARFKVLVKKYHPDVNQGNARVEELFKKITHSYNYLMQHYEEVE